MKTNRWIYAIMIVSSLAWVACDDDDDNGNEKPELNDSDERFVEVAARSNLAEIQFGEVATSKATDSLVKVFGQTMVTDHTTAQNELKDIADDFRDIDWPDNIGRMNDSILTELNNASGYTFDTLYISSQIKMHEAAIAEFRNASSNATDARVKAYANKYLPRIEMHLEHADSIHQALLTQQFDANSDGSDDGGTTDSGTSDGGTTN